MTVVNAGSVIDGKECNAIGAKLPLQTTRLSSEIEVRDCIVVGAKPATYVISGWLIEVNANKVLGA